MDRQSMVDLLMVRVDPAAYDPIERQREMQQIIHARFDEETPGGETAKTNYELAKRVCENAFAIQMELAELVERLNWKSWKAYDDDGKPPSKEVMLESAFEAIDIQHFLNNIYIALGLDWSDVLSMYETKQRENRARQERGY